MHILLFNNDKKVMPSYVVKYKKKKKRKKKGIHIQSADFIKLNEPNVQNKAQ